MTTHGRKVAKSQTSIKRQGRKAVPHRLKGVAPAIIEAYGMMQKKYSLEEIAARLAFLINDPDAHKHIKEKYKPALRKYIKKHNLMDWTEE